MICCGGSTAATEPSCLCRCEAAFAIETETSDGAQTRPTTYFIDLFFELPETEETRLAIRSGYRRDGTRMIVPGGIIRGSRIWLCAPLMFADGVPPTCAGSPAWG